MRYLAITLALGLAACGQEYGFVDGPSADPAAASALGDRTAPAGSQSYKMSASTTADKVDYLFVVDPSVSMQKVLKEVQAGFTSLGEDGFPRGARVAVMTTTPGAVDGSGRPHLAVGDAQGAIDDPGFLRLVTGASIAKWHGVADAPTGTCGDGWFSPTDTLPDGTPCLAAIGEMPLYAANTEAGLTAVAQLLHARGDKPLFRDGAAANIVFVSDTHDPGLPDVPIRNALIEMRPDFAALKALVDRANVVSSLRVHAIAPQEVCVDVEDWSGLGTAYYDAALQSGGRIFDVCTTEDYRGVLRDLSWAGAKPTLGVISVDGGAKVADVLVNGAPVRWSSHRDGAIVRIDEPLPETEAEVRVTFQ